MRDFITKWEDPAGNVQPNALAWFDDTDAIQSACQNNNQDLLRFLLEKGLRPVKEATRPAAINGKKANDYGCVRLLVGFGLE